LQEGRRLGVGSDIARIALGRGNTWLRRCIRKGLIKWARSRRCDAYDLARRILLPCRVRDYLRLRPKILHFNRPPSCANDRGWGWAALGPA
jgi:hypothetical protein